MKKFDLKEVLVPTLSLFLICTVVTLLLAVTNSVTAPQIEKLQIETANKTKAQVLSVAVFRNLLYHISNLTAIGTSS